MVTSDCRRRKNQNLRSVEPHPLQVQGKRSFQLKQYCKMTAAILRKALLPERDFALNDREPKIKNAAFAVVVNTATSKDAVIARLLLTPKSERDL